MVKEFVLDLCNARQRSGLTQEECGHLLGLDRSQLSDIETGNRLPHLTEIVGLSLLFGKSFESLFGSVFDEVRADLAANLETLPHRKNMKNQEWRMATLDGLRDTLSRLDPLSHAG